MILHVLTAVTRPKCLARVAVSLDEAARGGVEVHWHLRFDLEREHVGGQRLKNEMLNEIDSDWVWVLDDDTVAHPGLFPAVRAAVDEQPDAVAVVVSQKRRDGRDLRAVPQDARLGTIDIGQAVLRRSLIGDERIPEVYDGDGRFLEQLLAGRSDVIYLDRKLSYHNALKG